MVYSESEILLYLGNDFNSYITHTTIDKVIRDIKRDISIRYSRDMSNSSLFLRLTFSLA